MEYIRVYHPETNEPFDLPPHKADELRLQEGWLSQPFEKTEDIVQEVQEIESRTRRTSFKPAPEAE